jgi:hypothetical protein
VKYVPCCGVCADLLMCHVQMLFLVPTSLVMHNFWELEHGSPGHQIEFINFMKVRLRGGHCTCSVCRWLQSVAAGFNQGSTCSASGTLGAALVAAG